MDYPLVNIQKLWKDPPLLMGKSIFHSYVSLPEGICFFWYTRHTKKPMVIYEREAWYDMVIYIYGNKCMVIYIYGNKW